MSDNLSGYAGQPGIEEIDPAANPEEFLIDGREVRKVITMKTIDAKPERAQVAGRTVILCEIAGEIDDLAELISPSSGEVFTALLGDFEAVVFDDDGSVRKHAKAPMVFLPGGAHEAAVANFRKRQISDDPNSLPAAAFWLQFSAEPASNPRGYRYMWLNRLPYNPQQDRLARLRAQRERVAAIEARQREQQAALPSPARRR